MPILLHEQLQPAGEMGIWDIQEEEAWFRGRLRLAAAERSQLDRIKGRKRRLEWLAARQLVHRMSGRRHRGAFIKDEYGKPHLAGSDWHIAISHSHELAAAIAAPRSVGIDIQFIVAKIDRLTARFMRPEEQASLQSESRLAHLHVYWGAKESLYKAYGRRELDFCRHIRVQPFTFQPGGGTTQGCISKNGEVLPYQLWYRLMGSYVLVYAMASEARELPGGA